MLIRGGRSVDLCVGALERDGPRRGSVKPSSEADPARGGVKASSETELRPRERLTLERGGPHSKGVPLCRPGGPRGPPGSRSCRACVSSA
jgi:hypothetical protein